MKNLKPMIFGFFMTLVSVSSFASAPGCELNVVHPPLDQLSEKLLMKQLKKKKYTVTTSETAKKLNIEISSGKPYVTYCFSASCKHFYMGELSYELSENGEVIHLGSTYLDLGINEAIYIYESDYRFFRKLVKKALAELPKCK